MIALLGVGPELYRDKLFPINQLGVQPNPKAYCIRTCSVMDRDSFEIDCRMPEDLEPVETIVVNFIGSQRWFGGTQFQAEVWACTKGWQYVTFTEPPEVTARRRRWNKFVHQIDRVLGAERRRVEAGELFWRFDR